LKPEKVPDPFFNGLLKARIKDWDQNTELRDFGK
jgi:hypothetical protein